MNWTDWTTLAIAILGAGLGILNTMHAVADRRVRLRVTPAWAVGENYTGLSIEVANLSAFPVTIVEIGFTLGASGDPLPKRMMIPEDRLLYGDQSPARLGPREAKTIGFHADGLEGYDIRKAYARTSTGDFARGSSGALRQFIARGNKVL